jgi:hypothetical protein
MVKLQMKKADDKPLPDIFQLINLFCDHQWLANTRRSKDLGAFPAILKDKPLKSNVSSTPKNPKPDFKK